MSGPSEAELTMLGNLLLAAIREADIETDLTMGEVWAIAAALAAQRHFPFTDPPCRCWSCEIGREVGR